MNTFINNCKRNGNRWTINEILSLQREYELLDMSIQEIANKHGRTNRSILLKLDSEGIINSFDEVKGYKVFLSGDCEHFISSSKKTTSECIFTKNEEEEEDNEEDEDYVDENEEEEEDNEEEEESEVEELTDRVSTLESSVEDIQHILKQIYNQLVSKKTLTTLKV
jgi:predicted transcriptional regulator